MVVLSKRWFWCAMLGLMLGLYLYQTDNAISKNSDNVPEDFVTKSVMGQIMTDTAGILRYSLNGDEFAKESNRDQLQKHFKNLAAHSQVLARHGEGKEAGFEVTSDALARDAVDAKRWFERGRLAESRYIFHQMTENCVSCHLKLPEENNAELGNRFWDIIDGEKLSGIEQVHLQLVTRRFSEAMSTMESLFKDRQRALSDLALADIFTAYLRVGVGVKMDYKRCEAALSLVLQRPDVPDYLKVQAQDWIASLQYLEKHPKLVDFPTIEHARTLFQRGAGQMDFARDQDGLVYLIASGRQLNQLLDAETTASKAEQAEAYLLLGQIESVISKSFWVSSSNHYLERAIRMSPKSDTAKSAFAILEENIINDFTGSSGTDVPEDIQKRLNELKSLAM